MRHTLYLAILIIGVAAEEDHEREHKLNSPAKIATQKVRTGTGISATTLIKSLPTSTYTAVKQGATKPDVKVDQQTMTIAGQLKTVLSNSTTIEPTIKTVPETKPTTRLHLATISIIVAALLSAAVLAVVLGSYIRRRYRHQPGDVAEKSIIDCPTSPSFTSQKTSTSAILPTTRLSRLNVSQFQNLFPSSRTHSTVPSEFLFPVTNRCTIIAEDSISQANFADTHLIVRHDVVLPPYAVHAIIVSRAPRLLELLKCAAGPPYTIQLECHDPNLTVDGLNFVLGSLYSNDKTVPAPLSFGVLAAAVLLRLDEIAQNAWTICQQRCLEDLLDGFKFLESIKGMAYPAYTYTLQETLTSTLKGRIPSADSEEVLTRLPFPIVKEVLEHNALSEMERHSFARKVIGLRKGHLQGFEETVVMAFDGSKSGIEVLRRDKSARKKTLWKVR